jgi:hypothetical protein
MVEHQDAFLHPTKSYFTYYTSTITLDLSRFDGLFVQNPV